jgi:hypothetical protein
LEDHVIYWRGRVCRSAQCNTVAKITKGIVIAAIARMVLVVIGRASFVLAVKPRTSGADRLDLDQAQEEMWAAPQAVEQSQPRTKKKRAPLRAPRDPALFKPRI